MNKTELIVSCPCCQKENTLEMKREDFPALRTFLLEMVSREKVKQYTFSGNTKCICGKIVMGALTVTSGTT